MANFTNSIIYSEIYKQLIKLVPELLRLELGEGLQSHITNSIDLNLDVLNKNEDKMIIALSHYHKDKLGSGDFVPDPDMQVRIFPKYNIAEALSYQDGFVMENVYLDESRFYPKRKKKLNSFLYRWLKSCLAGGHQLRR